MLAYVILFVYLCTRKGLKHTNMKKLTFILLSIVALFLASCDNISPEVANAFKGEYWMETTNIGIINGKEESLNASSTWTPVSIYEKGGKLYVQTELLGAPDLNNNHPKEVEGTSATRILLLIIDKIHLIFI